MARGRTKVGGTAAQGTDPAWAAEFAQTAMVLPKALLSLAQSGDLAGSGLAPGAGGAGGAGGEAGSGGSSGSNNGGVSPSGAGGSSGVWGSGVSGGSGGSGGSGVTGGGSGVTGGGSGGSGVTGGGSGSAAVSATSGAGAAAAGATRGNGVSGSAPATTGSGTASPGSGQPTIAITPDGRPQASGIASWLDIQAGTCATNLAPMGATLTVTAAGHSVTCVVVSRGPFVVGRVVDLAKSTFSRLGPVSTGVLNVTISW